MDESIQLKIHNTKTRALNILENAKLYEYRGVVSKLFGADCGCKTAGA